MPRTAIYARYSSHSQRSESIEIQLDATRKYCSEHGLDVVHEYADYAQTGTNADRAEFQRMMSDAKKHMFDYVVIYKVTRIMRNRDEMSFARLVLKKAGVEILYAGEDISEGSAGVLQLGMLEVLAEYESALDGERIRDGIRKNAERCMANGHQMFGWDIVDGKYVLNEDEAEVVRSGIDMILSGHTVSEVTEAWAQWRTKRGKPWTVPAVRKVLRRRQNGGEYNYAGRSVPGGIPAIVPMEKELEAIAIMSRRGRPHKRKNSYLLSGKLFDGRDMGRMVGTCGTSKTGSRYYYYQCQTCGRTVSAPAIEGRVIEAVRQALLIPRNRERIAELVEAEEKVRKEQEKDDSQTRLLQSQIDDIHRAYENIWLAIEKGMDPPGGKERIDSLKEREKSLREQLIVAKSLEDVELDASAIRFWLENEAPSMDPEQMVFMFVSRVVLAPDGDGMEIRFTFESADPLDYDSSSNGFGESSSSSTIRLSDPDASASGSSCMKETYGFPLGGCIRFLHALSQALRRCTRSRQGRALRRHGRSQDRTRRTPFLGGAADIGRGGVGCHLLHWLPSALHLLPEPQHLAGRLRPQDYGQALGKDYARAPGPGSPEHQSRDAFPLCTLCA